MVPLSASHMKTHHVNNVLPSAIEVWKSGAPRVLVMRLQRGNGLSANASEPDAHAQYCNLRLDARLQFIFHRRFADKARLASCSLYPS